MSAVFFDSKPTCRLTFWSAPYSGPRVCECCGRPVSPIAGWWPAYICDDSQFIACWSCWGRYGFAVEMTGRIAQ